MTKRANIKQTYCDRKRSGEILHSLQTAVSPRRALAQLSHGGSPGNGLRHDNGTASLCACPEIALLPAHTH
jgi:hypothetical protein